METEIQAVVLRDGGTFAYTDEEILDMANDREYALLVAIQRAAERQRRQTRKMRREATTATATYFAGLALRDLNARCRFLRVVVPLGRPEVVR